MIPIHGSRRRMLIATGVALVFAPRLAFGHAERPIDSPPRPGSVPDLSRKSAHTLVVCKASSKPTRDAHDDIHARLETETGEALEQAKREETAWHVNAKLFRRCRFEHIQDAVNAAADDTAIKVLPGVYREEPSRAIPETSCGDLPGCAYSYEYHVANPNDANMIAILGKKNITLEGTGLRPEDVLVDAGFAKDVGIRTFDPTSEEVSVVVRDEDTLFYQGTIPAGSANWSSDPKGYVYADPSGARDGIVRLKLRSAKDGYAAKARVRDMRLAFPADTRTGTAVLRVGNDCWKGSMPCARRSRTTARCKKAALP